MKYIFITRVFYPVYTGEARIVSDVAFWLGNSNRKVSVITSTQGYENPNESFPKIECVNDVNIYRMKPLINGFDNRKPFGKILGFLGFYIRSIFYLLKLTQIDDVVVVITDPPFICLIAWGVSRLKKAKLVHWLLDIYPEVAQSLGVRFFRGSLTNFLKTLRNFTWKRGNSIVVLGERMRDFVKTQGVSSDLIQLFPNWENGSLIYPIFHSENSLRKEWGYEDKFVILYSGNMGRAHDFSTILNAALLLSERKDAKDIIFLFIGEGPEKNKLVRWVDKYNLKNIHFKPFQPQILLRE